MRFPPSFLDEIRARVPLSSVVGRRVKLKKQGREWRGLSPFQAEKTPSFYVNDQKGFYHCFSSGKHGDHFSFLMETEGLPFPEAVERVAQDAGVPMPVASPDMVVQEEARKTLYEVMELAAQFFQAQLHARAGAQARGYLLDREISPATQSLFRIGYAPAERTALKAFLTAQGVQLADMIETGLLIAGEDISVPYDRFRGRVMFPIEDMRGRIVAFGGRALDADAPAKYLNSPETPLFHKGLMLFNAHRARKAAHETGRLIAVEGYIDVIMMAQAGVFEAVAPLGTALTEDQLGLMWRMAEEPILCFDGDKAGRKAAYRAVDVALPKIAPARSLCFALLPEGLDPDDLIRRRGVAALNDVLSNARPLIEILWEREMQGADVTTPERRAGLDGRFRALTALIADGAVRKYYETDIAQRLRALLMPPSGYGGGYGQRRFDPAQGRGAGRSGSGRRLDREPIIASQSLRASPMMRGAAAQWPMREALIVATALNHPGLAQPHLETLAALDLEDVELSRLRYALLEVLSGDVNVDDPAVLKTLLDHQGVGEQVERLDSLAARAGLWFVKPDAAQVDAETAWLQMVLLHRRARSLHKEMKAAEVAFGNDPSEENDERLRALRQEVIATDGVEALIDGFGTLSGHGARSQ